MDQTVCRRERSVHPSKSGRPRLTTAAEDLVIVDYSHNNPMDAVPQIMTLQCPVGEFSIKKRLHAAGVHNRIPASKEQLTASNIQQRIQFCNKHR